MGVVMQPSMFNVRVPLARDEVFLMNTLTDAQLVVSPDVVALLDRCGAPAAECAGEPLLNLPVMYDLAERSWRAAEARGVRLFINIITNGLLLTPEIVDRLEPFGLNGIKVTLDGDKHTHDRMRPLRGGQGTFDRII